MRESCGNDPPPRVGSAWRDAIDLSMPDGGRDLIGDDGFCRVAARIGAELARTIEAAHGLLDHLEHALFDLGRAGAGIGHLDAHHVEVELREDLLLDGAVADEQPADDEHHHQEVGGHRVARHPGDQGEASGLSAHGWAASCPSMGRPVAGSIIRGLTVTPGTRPAMRLTTTWSFA